MLDALRNLLSPLEQAHRQLAFYQAHFFITRAAQGGGVRGFLKKSYPAPARADGRRVDIEVLKGLAFVNGS